ncbi:putative non-specific serine/threonine protein kinase [Helianthus annuus]|nr:putative non-specific serine/threonine protein kinase [Helianthus annuus]
MLAVFRKEKCEMIRFTHYRANDGRRKRRAKMEGPHGCNLKGKKKEIRKHTHGFEIMEILLIPLEISALSNMRKFVRYSRVKQFALRVN